MFRYFGSLAALCFALGLTSLCNAEPAVIAPTEKLTPEQERATFKLPPGFEVQLVAAEPDIHKPMNIAFDAQGRLWLTDTIDYPFPIQPGPGHDSLKILSDFDDSGRAKKISTFATGLSEPLGVLPIDDGKTHGAIVYSTPEIRRYVDTDGDGKADKIEPMLSGFQFVDTHGMTNNFTRGFDGWVYANHGFRNESTVKAQDGSSIQMTSGNTYRFKMDGTHIQYFAHGQVNPFGLCFDRFGNLFSADCHTRPQMLLLRGGYYQSFGRPDDGLGFAPEMCWHDHGSTAIAGTMVYDATQFPEEYRGNLFNGNPVTCAIDRDVIQWHGSSPVAIEKPDFMTSSDPWFRPVQVKLGPDGAVYIADFYNKIIGHYEVDLKHPGRDKTSGRIWRIVYKGDVTKSPPPTLPDFTKMSDAQLAGALGDANITVRMMAMNRLADVGGVNAVVAVSAAMRHPVSVDQTAHSLWVLERLGALKPEMLALAASQNKTPLLRMHVMRILAERTKWSDDERDMVVSALDDSDPTVRRCAADALGRHPDASAVRSLLSARAKVPADDTHLLYSIRMALRDQLAAAGVLAKTDGNTFSPAEKVAILDAALGVQSAEAGAFAAKAASEMDLPRDLAIRSLKHAVKLAADDQAVGHIAQAASKRFADDIDLQLDLLKSVREGLAVRGGAVPDAVQKWATDVTAKVLADLPTPNVAAPSWTSQPLDGVVSADPWVSQSRKCADGKSADFYSSLPRGETLTGSLRSRPFAAPAQLNFWIAGHNGQPPEKDPIKNIVRLRLVADNSIVAEAPPPRNDIAQKVTWDLSGQMGKQVYLEAVDADTRSAYAWLAFGRFEPDVAPIPAAATDQSKRIAAAVELAGGMKVAGVAGPVAKLLANASADLAVRIASAKALATVDPAGSVSPLLAVLSSGDSPPNLREACATALGTVHELSAYPAMVTALSVAPQTVQRSLALAMSATKDGGEALLATVGAGKASPRLLTDKLVRDRLKAAGIDQIDTRLAALTKGVPDADVTVQKLIDKRKAIFTSAKPTSLSADRGKVIFTKNCAVCHRVANEGAQVGPQLDGVGKRGIERLCEDILDPSRNVDGAFRYSILTLDDGDVVTGLQRRVEGESIVFADATGKEFTVPTAKIKKRTESQLSLMPSNFGDIISEPDFGDLVEFLRGK